MKNPEQGGADFNSLFKKAKQAQEQGTLSSEEGVTQFLDSTLSESKAQAVKEVLGDEKKLTGILESPEAQAILKKLTGGKPNG